MERVSPSRVDGAAQHLKQLCGSKSCRALDAGGGSVLHGRGHTRRALDLGDTSNLLLSNGEVDPEGLALHRDQGGGPVLAGGVGHLIAQRLAAAATGIMAAPFS